MNTTDKLVIDLKHLVRNAEELLEATGDAVGDKTTAMRERLSMALDTAKRSCLQLEKQARDGAKAADASIRKHPYESIGVALGIGLLLGIFAVRK